MATIRDVAREAGVSRQTVSRVINESPRVDPATRARIQEVMARLDYVPMPSARGLGSGRTLAIGVIAPFFTRPAIVARLQGIEAALAETEYDMLVFNVETVGRRDRVVHTLARRGRVDGLIAVSLPLRSREVNRIVEDRLAAVVLDARAPRLPSVMSNDVQGGRLAARHLIELGHRHIGFLGDFPRTDWGFSSSRMRKWGASLELREAGLTLDPENVVEGAHSHDGARALAFDLLGRPNRPTALFCASDTQALGALEAAEDRHISVPSGLSVVGYDDIEIAEYLQLTTVRQPLVESGRQSVEILMGILGGAQPDRRRTLLPVELVVRASTATGPVSEGRAAGALRTVRS